MTTRSIPHLVGVFSAIVIHSTVYAFYIVSVNKAGIKMNLVNQSEYDTMKIFPTEIMPAWWTHVLWQIIYPLQFSWLCGYIQLCCNVPGNEFLTKTTSPLVFFFFAIGEVFQLARVITFGHGYCMAAFFMSLLSAMFMIAACVAKMRSPCMVGLVLQCKGAGGFRFNLGYSMNAIGAFTSYSVFTMFVHLALVLAYFSPANATPQNAGTGCLVVFMILILANIGLDVTIFDRYARYQYFTYIFEVLAMGCVLFERNVPGSTNTVLTIVIMTIALAGFVAKVINSAVRDAMQKKEVDLNSSELPQKGGQIYPLN